MNICKDFNWKFYSFTQSIVNIHIMVNKHIESM